MLIKVLLGANIPKDVVVIDRSPGYAYFLFSSLDLTGQPFEMATRWSHVLSVVSCRMVFLASNRLTDNIK